MILLPPITLNFFLVFPRPITRRTSLLAALYLPPALLAIWDADLLIFSNRLAIATPLKSLEIVHRWELTHFGIYFTLAVVALAYTYRTAAAVGRKQIKWIYLGMIAGFLPFFAVSILKYKLWDVEVVIKETLAYAVVFAFGMIAFSTVNLILSHAIEERSALERNFLAFTSGLVIAGVLIPVKGRVESVIERILYRESYRHRRTMADFAQELATFND